MPERQLQDLSGSKELRDAQLPATSRPKALLMPSLGNDLAELTFGEDLSDP
jgi:hypothetical protein